MKIKELKQILNQLDDDALVYIQTSNMYWNVIQAEAISITRLLERDLNLNPVPKEFDTPKMLVIFTGNVMVR